MIDLNPTITQYLTKNHTRLKQAGYTENQISAIAAKQAISQLKHSPQTGEIITTRINYLLKQAKSKTILTFHKWHGDNLYTTDQKKRTHVTTGSWWDHRYIIRGVVRQHKPTFHFLCNGQSSTGSTQIGLWNETEQLHFPEFENIETNFAKSL